MNTQTYPLHHALKLHSTIYAIGSKAGHRVIVEVTGRGEALVLINGQAHPCTDMLQVITLLNRVMERDQWSLRPQARSSSKE